MNEIEQRALATFTQHWFTMVEACKYLEVVNDATLDHHVKVGTLKCIKIDDRTRFFAKSDLDALRAFWDARGGRRVGRPKKR